MITNTITVGYVVEIITYENDADNYESKTFFGLNKNTALFLKTIAEKFKTTNYVDITNFGNMQIPTAHYRYNEQADYVLDWFRETFDAIPPIHSDDEFDITDADDVYDCLLNIIGDWGDGEYFRYVESYDIKYNPTECQLNDVDENLDVITI